MRASRFFNYRAVFVLVVVAALAWPTPGRAGFILVTDPNSLGANDSASWSGFDVNNPTVDSTNGIKVQAGGIGSGFPTFGPTTLSGSPAIEEIGTTSPNTFGTSSNASISLTFSQPVTAAGGLMQAFEIGGGNQFGEGFQITAFDSNGSSQGFLITTNTNNPQFVGIVSATSNLSRLTISAFNFNISTLVEVGSLELQDAPVSSVPEPSSFTLASVGVLGFLGWGYWRRRLLAIV
jgi:hypothetical protein